MLFKLQGALLGALALGAAALDLGIGSGGRTIQNFNREASTSGDHISPVQPDLISSKIESTSLFKREDIDPSELYPAHNLSVPVDHFHNETLYEPHSNASFNLRYWFDASNYKPGGPVIVLQSGETSGVGRLPFLQKGMSSASRLPKMLLRE